MNVTLVGGTLQDPGHFTMCLPVSRVRCMTYSFSKVLALSYADTSYSCTWADPG